MTEADVLDFVRVSIGSVWALEMLMLVGDRPDRAWRLDELVHELRSSLAAITGASQLLQSAGLLARIGDDAYRYQPASERLDEIGKLVRKIYAVKPATVIGAVLEMPDDKLRAFAAAFRLKE